MKMKSVLQGAVLGSLAVLSTVAVAEESWLQLEEVVVVGAVRSTDAVVVADVDVAGDEALQEMPVAYE
jgi:hypothetical protein